MAPNKSPKPSPFTRTTIRSIPWIASTVGGFRSLQHRLFPMKSNRFKTALVITGAVMFLFSGSLSLNVDGPGDTAATPTTVQDGVNLAVERILTALCAGESKRVGAGQSTADATQIAENVSTLVAQAVLTLQPTEFRLPTHACPRARLRHLLLRPSKWQSHRLPLTLRVPLTLPAHRYPAAHEYTRANEYRGTSPTFTSTPEPTSTPVPTDTPTFTPTNTPTPTNMYTPTVIPTHCAQQYCVIMQRCDPGENTRAGWDYL